MDKLPGLPSYSSRLSKHSRNNNKQEAQTLALQSGNRELLVPLLCVNNTLLLVFFNSFNRKQSERLWTWNWSAGGHVATIYLNSLKTTDHLRYTSNLHLSDITFICHLPN